jgi:hypothetical protein
MGLSSMMTLIRQSGVDVCAPQRGETNHWIRSEPAMPRGNRSSYTCQAEHIEEGYEQRGVPEKGGRAPRVGHRINKQDQGGKKRGSGVGKQSDTSSSPKTPRWTGVGQPAQCRTIEVCKESCGHAPCPREVAHSPACSLRKRTTGPGLSSSARLRRRSFWVQSAPLEPCAAHLSHNACLRPYAHPVVEAHCVTASSSALCIPQCASSQPQGIVSTGEGRLSLSYRPGRLI